MNLTMQQCTTTTHHAFRYCRVRFDAFQLDNLCRNSCIHFQKSMTTLRVGSAKEKETVKIRKTMGPLQLTVTWYKLILLESKQRTGASKKSDFIQSNLDFLCFGCPSALLALQQGDFVQCNRKQQRAHFFSFIMIQGK